MADDITTSSVHAAQHWTNLYRKRASFDHTVRCLKRQLRGVAADRRDEAARMALPILIADAEAFGQRFNLWEARLTQLT